uniref:Esterase n=1 Tax=Oryza meridionalis TaxID=40149 RepID=A0A0E0DLN5_9ORYZ
MRMRGSRIALLLLMLLQCGGLPRIAVGRCVVFNFGDSNSDTGSLPAAFGFYLGPPAGRRFFHRQTGRWSDGRLYIDFIAEKLKISYLSPYMESSGSDFTSGVNFAVAGAAVTQKSAIPLGLDTQVNQFLHFKNRTRELRPRGAGSMIAESEFRDAVYAIDIGQNDITLAFLANLTLPEVERELAASAARVGDAVRALRASGARKFWVYNTGPIGCLPQTLALRQKPGDELDAAGCLAAYNAAARSFNAELAAACRRLAAEYGGGKDSATVVCTDMYAIKYDLFANHSRYGFERPLMACCGHGGPPYNYANLKTCGQPTATACPEGERHVIWDGVHYTEDANAIVARKVLSGDFSSPRTKLKALCK